MGEKQIEIIVRKQESLIRLEHFMGDQNIVVNGKDPFVKVPPEYLGQDMHLLMTMSASGATAHLLPSMVVKKNKKVFKESVCELQYGDQLDITIGPFHFDMRCREVQKPIISSTIREGDWRFGQILGGVAIVQLMMLLLIVDVAALI